MSRWQFLDAAVNGTVERQRFECEEIDQRSGVDCAVKSGQQFERAALGRKRQPTVDHMIEERLLAVRIPRAEKRARALVVQRESEHAV